MFEVEVVYRFEFEKVGDFVERCVSAVKIEEDRVRFVRLEDVKWYIQFLKELSDSEKIISIRYYVV